LRQTIQIYRVDRILKFFDEYYWRPCGAAIVSPTTSEAVNNCQSKFRLLWNLAANDQILIKILAQDLVFAA
jgi:hypothetical protein